MRKAPGWLSTAGQKMALNDQAVQLWKMPGCISGRRPDQDAVTGAAGADRAGGGMDSDAVTVAGARVYHLRIGAPPRGPPPPEGVAWDRCTGCG